MPQTDSERQAWLEEKHREIAQMAGGLAHEIKNPLSTLGLNLELLAEDFADAKDCLDPQIEQRASRKLRVLQQECRRLQDILEDFLRFARTTELHTKATDVKDLLADLIEFHRPQLQAGGVLVRDDLDDGLPPVALDAGLFRQAVTNLLLNAGQAMDDGGELIVTAKRSGDAVQVGIIDTGKGMTPETLDKIFKPFFSTRAGGSGLGLPMTRKIVESHHGALLVDSEPGKGTAFTIELPAL